MERDRTSATSLLIAPRIASWFRPRFGTTSNFVLSRYLNSRQLVRADGDSGAFILPQTFSNLRAYEWGFSIDYARGIRQILGDSSGVGNVIRRFRPLDVTRRTTRTSTYDLAVFQPSLGYILGLGGLSNFLTQDGNPSLGATQTVATQLATGLDFGFGLTISALYSEIATDRYQTIGGAQRLAVIYQREWPSGQVRFSHPFSRGPFALLSFGATIRQRQGSTTQPVTNTIVSVVSNQSRNVSPELGITFRNGIGAGHQPEPAQAAVGQQWGADAAGPGRPERQPDLCVPVAARIEQGAQAGTLILQRSRVQGHPVPVPGRQPGLPGHQRHAAAGVSRQYRYRYHLHPDRGPSARVYRERLPEPGPEELPAVPGRFAQPVALCRGLSMTQYRLTGLLALLVFLGACESQRPAPPREFDGAAAMRNVETQVAFGPRVPGMPGHAAMAAWLDSLAHATADSVYIQDWVNFTAKGEKLSLRNVMMRFNPSAPDRILFLTHWDTRPIAERSADSADRKKPIAGANDGASGVAVLLGMADALKKTPPAIGVDLLFVDGEDYGSFEDSTETLLGARYYAKNQAPGPKPLFAVLLDMVGDRDLQIYQEGNSLLGAPEVVERVWDAAKIAGYSKVFIATPGPDHGGRPPAAAAGGHPRDRRDRLHLRQQQQPLAQHRRHARQAERTEPAGSRGRDDGGDPSRGRRKKVATPAIWVPPSSNGTRHSQDDP